MKNIIEEYKCMLLKMIFTSLDVTQTENKKPKKNFKFSIMWQYLAHIADSIFIDVTSVN